MSLPIDQYRHHFAGFGLTEAQEADIIRALYRVMEGFADLAFGIDATQVSLGITGDDDTKVETNALDFGPHLTSTFNDAAGGYAAGKTDS